MVAPPGFVDATLILQSAVYMLVHRGKVIYIGKAKRAMNRIYAHKAKGKKYSWDIVKAFNFDQVFLMPVHVDRLDEVEREMIQLYKPYYNINLKSAEKARLPDSFFARLNPSLPVTQPPPPAPKFERRV